MSKRLQVILRDPEYREIQKAARSSHMTLAQWVRRALALARSQESPGDIGKKLEVVRAAARCEFPTGEMDAMLAEIESGYSGGAGS